MKARQSERDKYLLGSVLVLALLIGGGGSKGLYTDSIIQIAALVCSAIVLSSSGGSRLDRRAVWLIVAVVVVMAVQLVPLPASLVDRLRPDFFANEFVGLDREGGTRFITLGFGRTLECLLYVVACAAFFLAVARLRPEQVYGLLPFFFMAVICNALAGAIQYSLADNVSIVGFLPFTIRAALFGNVNHFSTLLFASIPFIVFHGLFRGHPISGALGLAAVLLILLAAGSRAGVLIGLAITGMSVIFLSSRSQLGRLGLVALFIGMSVYTVGVWSKVSVDALDPEFGRGEFARTTIEGIKANWPLGVGYGTFQSSYQIYERETMIFRPFVNHAHNDYLEIVFEGGVAAAVLLGAYLLLLLSTVFSAYSAFQKAALLSITFILVHSLVDYPLRTAALGISFAFMNGILFHTAIGPRVRRDAEFVEVEHNGQMLAVEVESPGRHTRRR